VRCLALAWLVGDTEELVSLVKENHLEADPVVFLVNVDIVAELVFLVNVKLLVADIVVLVIYVKEVQQEVDPAVCLVKVEDEIDRAVPLETRRLVEGRGRIRIW